MKKTPVSFVRFGKQGPGHSVVSSFIFLQGWEERSWQRSIGRAKVVNYMTGPTAWVGGMTSHIIWEILILSYRIRSQA